MEKENSTNQGGNFDQPIVSRRFLTLKQIIGMTYFVLSFGILRYKYDTIYHTGFAKWEKDWLNDLFGGKKG